MLKRLLKASLWALLLLLGSTAQAQAQLPSSSALAVPALSGHVVDQAGLLDAGQRQRLDNVLADYEKKSGSQIAVLIVKSTEPEVIEQFSIRVAEAWKLGRKGIDDGVLLLVAPENSKAARRLRIEAGRGVQGVLTDAQSKRVLQDVIAPHFRQKDYYGGLVAGTTAIAALLDKEQFKPPPHKPAASAMAASSTEGLLFAVIAIGVGLVMLLSFAGKSRSPNLSRGSPARSSWESGATGFVIGNILGNLNNQSHHGGFSGGDFSGGGSSGGDSSFSGGGGSFDGGGASGDW